MADPSEGAELTLTSGEGECETRVCDTDGEPQCHVAEPTGDICLARLRAQPLSMETLQGARDGLERRGELSEELGSCLDLALERFCREPQCVQENAKLLVHWDGGELEFIAGQGQCEISVSCSGGEPQYHITEKTWDVFVSWMNSHPEPLSINNLKRVRSTLESWGLLGEALSGCFGEAISQFSREPPCVQGNARLRIQRGKRQLTFTSGKGECEITVSYEDGKPQYRAVKIPLRGYLAGLRDHRRPSLSADTLQRVLRELGSCDGDTGALRACFDRAWQGFSREPRCVQENARLGIRWDGGELEFVSGQGQCAISVLLADGRPQYHITELGGDMPVTWSHSSPEPLSVADLARVRDRLGHWGVLGEELSGCFGEAISQFRREPPSVQENARLLIQWSGEELEFTSGKGECEITVSYEDGKPQYRAVKIPLRGYLAGLRNHRRPSLSADTLQRVLRELGSCVGDTGALRACFDQAWQGFSREPRCVQENARLLIRWGGGELEFISGQGQCEISVLLADGEPQYHITELGGDRPVTWSHASPEPLSVADLERVRDRLGRWGALGEELSGCFGEAISQFSQEPQYVQGNARLRIWWDARSLEFLSGEGECEISVCCRVGKPQYAIGELPVNMYLDWLHDHPKPLSADTLWSVWDKLGSCKGDRDNLRACLHRALEEFKREPRCVQENARLLIQWGKKEVKFTSGKGECEISVGYGDRGPQYCAVKIPLPEYLTRLRAHRLSLSADTLWRVLSELGSCDGDTGALRACFDRAWQGFSREPRCVQENARLLIRWGGGELEFVSGRGQCEISVLLTDGEPQYHITELGGDRPVTWSQTSPEPLSVADLARVWDRLGRWGALGEELSGCFGEAISQFSREPQCVQGNARLRLCWGGQSLEFLSGKGQYMFSVSYQEGNPRYHFHVETLPVHLYVTRLRSRKDPLSADSLLRFHTELVRCQGDTAAPRVCLNRAWEGFSREPRCVQENARLLIQWHGGELEFVSGQGQCEISVLYADGRPQYHITELGGDRPVTWSHTSPEPLSVADLARVRDRLGRWGALGEELSGCFGEAISQFSREPRCVQENARLLIHGGWGELEFVSGQGQCEILVLLTDGEPQYHITELGGDRPVTWSHASPEPLSVADLVRVRDRLGHWGALGEELSSCFVEAISQFSQEPRCVQGNAKMGIQWDGGSLQFLSGKGQCEISVHYRDGKAWYDIKELPFQMYLDWLCTHPDPLSADTLWRVRDKLGSCKGDKANLIACFDCAWEGFHQEPQYVQENARLLIQWGRRQLKFTSGKGECEISVRYGASGAKYCAVKIPVHLCDK